MSLGIVLKRDNVLRTPQYFLEDVSSRPIFCGVLNSKALNIFNDKCLPEMKEKMDTPLMIKFIKNQFYPLIVGVELYTEERQYDVELRKNLEKIFYKYF